MFFIMPITIVVKEAQPKTKKRFTAIFRKHKGGAAGAGGVLGKLGIFG